jgi:hypothetical protein
MPQASRPKYEKHSIWCSMMVFMLYFFVFREENDVDLYIGNISDPNLAGLEMKKTIKNYKKEGKDTSGMRHQILAKFSLLNFLHEI